MYQAFEKIIKRATGIDQKILLNFYSYIDLRISELNGSWTVVQKVQKFTSSQQIIYKRKGRSESAPTVYYLLLTDHCPASELLPK